MPVSTDELRLLDQAPADLELLDQLANAAAEPRLSERGNRTNIDSLPRLMRKPWRQLVRSVKALAAPPTDVELHAVRIRAKRCSA